MNSKELNSWDSFKSDTKDAVGFALIAGALAYTVFYPFAIMVGVSKMKEEDRPKFWKKFWRSGITWIWIACVIVFTTWIICNWSSYFAVTSFS